MALDDILKGVALDDILAEGGIPAIAAGIGALILAPVVIPVLAGMGKPAAKAVIKESIKLYEKGKESLAEVGEIFEDIVAEAKAEIAEEDHSVKSNEADNQPQIIVVND